ncbi:MAG: hypothetical protein IKZ51_06365 [Bacteroidales bacterium]|nr:hypothetical protein [Bacteroidales bacterium]
MKKIFYIIAAAVIALGLSSCNSKIENPTERNFIGTWDLESYEIVGADGSVTSVAAKTLDYWVVKDGTVSMYEANKLSREADFAVKDKMIYINGVSTYRIDEMTRKEMTISQDGFGILVSTYKYHYKRR